MPDFPVQRKAISANTTSPGSLSGLSASNSHFLLTYQMMGSNASWLLLGFLLNQIYIYYRRSKRDSYYIRLLAIVTIVVQLVERCTELRSLWI